MAAQGLGRVEQIVAAALLYGFAHDVACEAGTLAALGHDSKAIAHSTNAVCSVANGCTDLVVGNAFAQTDIHGVVALLCSNSEQI